MKSILAAVLFATLSLASAQAMPVAPAPDDGMTTFVRQGCGPGFARNAAGRCRPAYMTRTCPPGKHRGVLGGCRPNR